MRSKSNPQIMLMVLFLAVVSLIGGSIEVWVLRTRGQQDGTDVAVTNVIAYPTSVVQGEPVHIDVMVENQAWHNHDLGETFDVTLRARGIGTGQLIPIGTQTVYDFLPLSIEILSFTWDTTAVLFDTYQIIAEAILPEDEDPEDNTLADGAVLITFLSDIRGPAAPDHPPDGQVDLWDLGFVGLAYGETIADPEWDIYKIADIRGPEEPGHPPDGQVDLWDLSYFGLQYGQSIYG